MLALMFVLAAKPARAGFVSHWLARDVEVITVTDVTDAGRERPVATAEHPLRYTLVYAGETCFGPTWAGEATPGTADVLRWIKAALKSQHYLPATNLHPADLAIVYGWGMLSGGSARSALGFLGGQKLDLMWTQSGSPFSAGIGESDPRLIMRDAFIGGINGKVWDFAAEDLFLCVLRCFTRDSLYGTKATKLWETRFACPASGLSLRNALPLMIRAAAPHFGRETAQPVPLDASDAFEGRVDMGELRFLENEPGPPPPGSDGSHAR